MLKINYVSDVHLEFGAATIDNGNDAKVLVIAGDLLVVEDIKRHGDKALEANFTPDGHRQETTLTYVQFLRQCASLYDHVLVVVGNHEFYDSELDTAVGIYRDFLAKISPKLQLLENNTVIIDGVLFIGAALWTDMNGQDPHTMWQIRQTMNDYNTIRVAKEEYRKLRPEDTVSCHRKSVAFFEYTLADNCAKDNYPVVVVSHHAPTYESVPPHFRGDVLTNGAYASNLSELILGFPQIKHWIHGHMHNACEYNVGGTVVHCNPRGYFGHQTTERGLVLNSIDV